MDEPPAVGYQSLITQVPCIVLLNDLTVTTRIPIVSILLEKAGELIDSDGLGDRNGLNISSIVG
jgi:hypothetical protein